MSHIGHEEIKSFAEDKVNLPAPTAKKHRHQVKALRERLEGKIAADPDYGLVKMVHAGSVAKGTALRDVGQELTFSSGQTQLDWNSSTSSLPVILADSTNDYIYGPTGEPVEEFNTTPAGTSNPNYPFFLTYTPSDSSWLVTTVQGVEDAYYRYDAYGNLALGTPATPFGYSGQYQDGLVSAQGFYDMRARWYDNTTGEFMSVDPALASTHQAYAYANGDGVNKVDPLGLSVYGKCSHDSPQNADICDENQLYGMDYSPLSSGLQQTLYQQAKRIVKDGLEYEIGPTVAQLASSLFSISSSYVTYSYVQTSLEGAINIPYIDVYSQPPYNFTGSTVDGMGGLQAVTYYYGEQDPGFVYFELSLVQNVSARILVSVLEQFSAAATEIASELSSTSGSSCTVTL